MSPRVRRFVALLGVVTWAVLLLNLLRPGPLGWNGHIKGEDYAHFYTLGGLAAEGRADLLYDTRGQSAYLAQAIPGTPPTVFIPVYGPQVALLFRPLAAFGYLPSLVLWSAITIAGFVACCLATLRWCPHLMTHRRDVLLLAAASPALWQLVLHGQTSVVAMASLTAGTLFLRARRDVLAGAVLGVLFYKPQFALTIGAVLVLTGRWKAVAAMGATTLVQVWAAWAVFGLPSLFEYARMIQRLPTLTYLIEPKLYLMHSLKAFFSLLPGVGMVAVPLTIVASVTALLLIVRHFRSARDEQLGFAALLIGTLLISPHTSVYDLVIVAPALMLMADRWIAGGRVEWSARWGVLAAAYILPIWPTASQLLFLQPMVICLAWLLVDSCPGGFAPRNPPAGFRLRAKTFGETSP
jgi:alpha-1,2-mannosyltransferase